MKSINIARFISIGGILTTFSVLFQSAPIFLPAIGMALSPLSTLPIALAAYLNISLGIIVLFASALILIFISIQESAIFLFATGLIGIVIGTLLHRKGIKISILFSAIALSLGMIFLTYIAGIPVFGNFTNSISTSISLLIFITFSLIYVSIWSICLRKFFIFLIKIKVLSPF